MCCHRWLMNLYFLSVMHVINVVQTMCFKKTYSGQKKVPLCKPFKIGISDGHILDMLGPYIVPQI